MSLHQAINGAEEELTKDKGWATNQFFVEVATSYTDDTPKLIDIMTTLGHKTRQSKKTKQKTHSDQKYWLPSTFNENTDEFRKEHIVPHFSNAALQTGFGLIACGWQDNRSYLKLQCERGRHYQAEKKQEQSSQSKDKDIITEAKVATTKRAVKGEEDHCCLRNQIGASHMHWDLMKQA